MQIEKALQASIDTKQTILENKVLLSEIARVADVMVEALRNGHKILFCGNGGSAADAQHLAAELSGRFHICISYI